MEDLPSERMQEVLELLYQGRKIEAINVYRELRHCSLLDAKTFVDGLEDELEERTPQEFRASASGCASILAVFLVSALCALSTASLLVRAGS